MTSDAALFVMPTVTAGDSGPVAVWVSAAGWAGAARRLLGEAWILSPEGVFSPDDALEHASRPALVPKVRGPWRRYAPASAVTAYKDLRRVRRARGFSRIAAGTALPGPKPVFVWQRHELFHTAGFDLARRLSRPLVLFVDAPQVWEERQWGVRRLGWAAVLEAAGDRRLLRSADVLACVSEEVAGAVAALGVHENRILVTPCSVDPAQFGPDVPGHTVRERLGLQDRLVVGWIGSFRPFHGLDLLLEAANSLANRIPNLTILLVGDGQERPRLERLARLNGSLNVVFTGTVPYGQMAEHIAAMDVAVLPAEASNGYHYSPLKLVEYMASGKAIVAAQVGQVGRFLSDGVDALTVPAGNAPALAGAIERLAADPALRCAIGTRARETAVRERSWDRQVQQVLEAIARHPVTQGVSR